MQRDSGRTRRDGRRDARDDSTTDAVFVAFADAWRRRLLRALVRRERDGDAPPAVSTADASVRARHVHLPKLVDAGLVTWDSSADVVRPGPAFDAVRPLVDASAAEE